MNSQLLQVVCLTGMLFLIGCTNSDWRTASRESTEITPDATTKEAVLHVYGADAWGWRGYHGQPVLRIATDIPDRYWYGAKPRLLKSHQGIGVDELIAAVEKAARAYPWQKNYKAFPGPNNNTFTAWVAKQVPELELKLPFSAIGKGYVD